MYLDDAKAQFEQLCQNERIPFEARPASEAEIQNAEQQLRIRFPIAYREFLLWMGNGGHHFLDHFVFSISRLPLNQIDARELVEDDTSETLPEDEIVLFWGNQGYYFKFICASDGDNPRVHEFYEGEEFTWNQFENIEALLLNGIEWYEERLKSSNSPIVWQG